jgi:hypothetical protein
MATGHILDFNLSELTSFTKDSNAIDNLGGTGISEDIRLLVNNTSNVSNLLSSEYIVDGFRVKITNPARIAFSNRTVITVDDILCVVTESNAVDSFVLRRVSTNEIVIPSGNMIRRDQITFETFDNLDKIRTPSTVPQTQSGISNLLSENSSVDENGNISGGNDIYDFNITGYIDEVDQTISIYNFKRSQSIDLTTDNTISDNFRVDGVIYIEKLDEFGNQVLAQNEILPTDPGVFIVRDGEEKRAFSDMSNPWDDTTNAGYISTVSDKASVTSLEISEPDIIGISIETVTATAISTATHRIPVVINGERYNLLCVAS